MAWRDLEEIVEQAKDLAERLGERWDPDLEGILTFCFEASDPALPNDRASLKPYVSRYYKARNGLIQPKELGTKADPAVDWVLQAFYGLSEQSCADESLAHRRSMQAENIIGALLERYIASVLRPEGWIWCCGSTAKYIDFVHRERKEALQIKNRSNSENSASKSVRDGTKIRPWFRIDAKSGKTFWHTLPASPGLLSEAGFREFIRRYASEILPKSERE